MCTLYVKVLISVQMLDKTLLNYAAIMNLKQDLHLQGSEYSWLGSIFYFGYLAGTFVHAYFLQRLPLSPYISVIVIIWGVVLACHAAALSFSSFMAVRFFLGIFEAAINPGFILLTGRFYTRHEQVVRTAIWYSMNGWAMIVGGSMTYGILVHPAPTLNRWQEMFVGVGVCTVAFGILCLYVSASHASFIMPSLPETTKYLTPDERRIAVARIAENKSGTHDTKFKKYQLWEAVKDIRLYLVFLAFVTVNITNGGISIFATQIINSFGYSKPRSALLDMTKGASEVVAVVLGTLLYVWKGRRDVPSIFGYIIAIVGGVMMTTLDSRHNPSRVAGIALLYFFPISYPMLYSWMIAAVSGTTKRIVFNATLQVAYCVGNIIGPQVYPKTGTDYKVATTIDYVMLVVSAVFMILLSLVHYVWNRQRESSKHALVAFSEQEQLERDLSDLTDKERPEFRYPY